jgi:hypothetical protein
MIQNTYWKQIRDSLGCFDHAGIQLALTAWLDQELPDRRITPIDATVLSSQITPIIAPYVGSWYYALNIAIGDQRLSRWCWCHSFQATLQASTPDQVLAQATSALLGQVEQVHDFMGRLLKVFERVTLAPNASAAQIHRALDSVLDFVLRETRCHVEADDDFAAEILEHFLEAKGLSPSSLLRTQIEFAVKRALNRPIELHRQPVQLPRWPIATVQPTTTKCQFHAALN